MDGSSVSRRVIPRTATHPIDVCNVGGIYSNQAREPCKTETIAPHVHVLYRDIPFILNITHPCTG
jgi:hypothetical protein